MIKTEQTNLDLSDGNEILSSEEVEFTRNRVKPYKATYHVTGSHREFQRDVQNADVVATAQKVVLESTFQQGEKPKKEQELVAQMILRTHFGRKILEALKNIQDCAKTPRASSYALSIIKNARALFEHSYEDSFTTVVMCLHDALAFGDGWSLYSAEEYKEAELILKKACSDQNLTSKKSEKALIGLSDAGFDIFASDSEDY